MISDEYGSWLTVLPWRQERKSKAWVPDQARAGPRRGQMGWRNTETREFRWDRPTEHTTQPLTSGPESETAVLLQGGGYEVFVVGGSVRDYLLGRDAKDIDLTTNATPDQVTQYYQSLGYKVVPTGLEFGTVTVLHPDEGPIEITTYREDIGSSDARRPDEVRFASTIEEDLARRDLTINAMAYDPSTHRLVDPYGGFDDLNNRLIRAVGDPKERFTEDGLRPMRALRFGSVLGFDIEGKTYAAMKDPEVQEAFSKVSKERIRDELLKGMKGMDPRTMIEGLMDTGLNQHVLPELDAQKGMEQPRKYHEHDVLEHSIQAMEFAPPDKPVVRMVALLHDVAKPDTLGHHEDGTPHFHGHDRVGSEKVEEVMRRLKFSNAEIEKAKVLVKFHLFNYDPDWDDKRIRRFVSKVGLENMEDLIAVRRADLLAHGTVDAKQRAGWLADLERRLDQMGETAVPPKLAISGHDIMGMGIEQGPEVGRVLGYLRELVTDEPALNNPEALMGAARQFLGKADVMGDWCLFHKDYCNMDCESERGLFPVGPGPEEPDERAVHALEGDLESFYTESEAPADLQKAWYPYTGSRGGKGWYNPDEDRVVYQDEPPGETGTPDAVRSIDHTVTYVHNMRWDSIARDIGRFNQLATSEISTEEERSVYRAMSKRYTNEVVESIEDDAPDDPADWDFFKPLPNGYYVEYDSHDVLLVKPLPSVHLYNEETGESTNFKYNTDSPSGSLDLNSVRPSPDWDDAVSQRADSILDHISESTDLDRDELVGGMIDHVKEHVEQSNVFSRARYGSVMSILRDGRMMSQHESQSSGGLLNPRHRLEMEMGMFSVDESRPISQFPIYAYLSKDPDGFYGRDGQSIHSAVIYGEFTIKLKPGAKERSTFTIGNTLDTNRGGDQRISPSRTSNPIHLSLDWDVVQEYLDLGHTYDEVLESIVHPDHYSSLSSYWEVQVHGGVTLDDIEEIVVPEEMRGGPRMDLLESLAKKRGVKIKWK